MNSAAWVMSKKLGLGVKMNGEIVCVARDRMLDSKNMSALVSPAMNWSSRSLRYSYGARGPSGGITCEQLVNDPEFHSLECAKNEWRVDQVKNPAVWDKVYPFVDSNRKRCKG